MISSSSNRVVVTGMGIVSPCGIGLDAYWDALINCKSGIGPITLFDTSDYPLKIAGEIKDFDLRDHFERDCKPNRLGRQTQLGLVACKMAVEHAGLDGNFRGDAPLRLVVGVCSAAADIIEKAKEIIMTKGADRVRPYMVGACQPHAISAALVSLLNTQVSVTTLSSACPSGLDAMSTAFKMISRGESDIVIVGATDSPLSNTGVAGFAAAGIPSCSTDFPPEEISRPFDEKRSGVVISEGAGFVVLERFDSALARGAKPLMEILGGATVTDTPEATEGMEGLYHSMDMALKNSGLCPGEVDYICANACSDQFGDIAEVQRIKKLFGEYAYQLPVSSIRGVTGHPLAAAGMFQVIACALMMKHQKVIPTANLHFSDPECDLDHVPLFARNISISTAIANGHGMGGENSSIVMKSVE
ncbi:beta-ketoacyl-[acyl-carrier-protein] synthase family protein [Tichowtungia aerotolerans]|uniref:Beta-ketoacyl-[acyl-carrier-protein] synthase II n=1 Tax=Tichowtungia aerotolerans TaxID=2697043 RepID=A0A6P1M9B2_9BACT|nr:beta-ketoacyl-[acyl-carrier-protein] synthase family protein [Tichowtungia aerotolerans]QHI69653.1 beta-ketoacyl-[acyl-carrier-protein] synthase II [Tichowtungia aerotolerans]